MSHHRIGCRCCNRLSCYSAAPCSYLNALPGTPDTYHWILSGWTPATLSDVSGGYQLAVGDGTYLFLDGAARQQLVEFVTAEFYAPQHTPACAWQWPTAGFTHAWPGIQQWSGSDRTGSLLRTYGPFWCRIIRTGTGTITVDLYLTASGTYDATPQLVIFTGSASGVSQDGSTEIVVNNSGGLLGTGGTITLKPCPTGFVLLFGSTGACPDGGSAPSYVTIDEEDDLIAAFPGAGGDPKDPDFPTYPEYAVWDGTLERWWYSGFLGYYNGGLSPGGNNLVPDGAGNYYHAYIGLDLHTSTWPPRWRLTVTVRDEFFDPVLIWRGDRYVGCWPTGEFRRLDGYLTTATMHISDPPLP